ncbi:hypothetical protein OG948_14500 [Embleya sp. NBC_00888]|uniref:hypothetical protein n=1 Tax=Embleya sp. NBC_00888 TaxID=2975960 RepID=UPI003867651F|nr:hypothetical protein OG948_14500 [Embleya sp. NBC_00888]
MSARPRGGLGALIVTGAVLGTVLVFYYGPGGGEFGPSHTNVTDQAGPSGGGSFRPVPSDGGEATNPPPSSEGSTGSDTSGGTDGAESTPGAGDLGWDTRIEQPRSPARVDGNVNPGVLAVSTPGTGQSRLTVDRVGGIARGALNPMLVQDFRGSRNGWTLTGAMSDFRAENGTRIEAHNLVWDPYCTPHPGRGPYPSSAKPGNRAQSSRTATLCSTSSSSSVTGGEFDVGAELTLRLPDRNTSAESYSATLTLTLS